jgi:hypothetical protein
VGPTDGRGVLEKIKISCTCLYWLTCFVVLLPIKPTAADRYTVYRLVVTLISVKYLYD